MNAQNRIASGKTQVKRARTSPRRAKGLGVKEGARAVNDGVTS